MERKCYPILFLLMVAILNGCASYPYQGTMGGTGFSANTLPPPGAEMLWRQAEQERQRGDINSAIQIWRQIAQTYPNNIIAPKALYNVGSTYAEEKQNDLALEYFNYIVKNYPQWEGVSATQVNRLQALLAMGQRQRVLEEGSSLWPTFSQNSRFGVPLTLVMADAYQEIGDATNGFIWLERGFALVQDEEMKKHLTQSALSLLEKADGTTVERLLAQNPSPTMRVFPEFRLAQIEKERGQTEAARRRLLDLLNTDPSHPLVPQIRAALGETSTATRVTTGPVQPDRIGCLAPINGRYAKFGQKIIRGFTLAVEDWNRTYADDPVTLVIKDTQAEPELAAKAMEELIAEGVPAILGPLSAPSAKRIAPLADQANIPLLTLTRRDEDTSNSPFVLHIFLDNRQMIQALVNYCREKLGYTSFAALYPNDRYGKSLADIFAEVVRGSGGDLLASVSYEPGATDFKDPIQKLMDLAKQNSPPSTSARQKAPFHALFIPDQAQTVSLVAPQLLYYNMLGVTLLGTNLWAEQDLVQAGGVYMEQALFVTPFFAGSQSQDVQAFGSRFQALYQSSPSYLEAQAYDAVMLLLQARHRLRRSSMDRLSLLQEILQTRDYKGVAGNYSFTPQGDLERNYLVLQVLNGRVVQQFPESEFGPPPQGSDTRETIYVVQPPGQAP